ncbi:MAG: hypothetical protein AAF600_07980 [Bacteroidota bacterium]
MIWLLIKLTSGFGNEYIIYFPDYNSSYRNEVSSIVSDFNNADLSSKLRAERFEKLNSEVLAEYPLPQNLKNETYTGPTNRKVDSQKINEVFTNQLPYRDILKPSLNTQAV